MALTVRREGVSSSGTISRPLPVAIDLSRADPAVIQRRQRLGYEAIPSTAVYGIRSPRRFELRLQRGNSDRYAVHIQVTVINGAGQTVAAITRADGQGEWALLPAGEYRILAALLIPEEVELELAIEARPARTRLGPVVASGQGEGRLQRATGLRGAASGSAPHQLRIEQPQLIGRGGGSGGGVLTLLATRTSAGRCQARTGGLFQAAATTAAMVWVDGYGRTLGPGISAAPVALTAPELVTGTDWAVSTRFRDATTSQLLDLTGISFTAELWDQERSFRYALCTITVENALGGGPVVAALTPEQSAAVGRYDGEEVVFDLRGVDSSGRLAYLLEGLVTVRFGLSEP